MVCVLTAGGLGYRPRPRVLRVCSGTTSQAHLLKRQSARGTCGRYMGQKAWFQEYAATWGQTRICHYARFSSKVEDVQSKGAGEDVQHMSKARSMPMALARTSKVRSMPRARSRAPEKLHGSSAATGTSFTNGVKSLTAPSCVLCRETSPAGSRRCCSQPTASVRANYPISRAADQIYASPRESAEHSQQQPAADPSASRFSGA